MLLGTLLLGAAARWMAANAKKSAAPSGPPCDGCTGPLPDRHAYTTCCDTKLCDRCLPIYRERSPVHCCVCRTPH